MYILFEYNFWSTDWIFHSFFSSNWVYLFYYTLLFQWQSKKFQLLIDDEEMINNLDQVRVHNNMMWTIFRSMTTIDLI